MRNLHEVIMSHERQQKNSGTARKDDTAAAYRNVLYIKKYRPHLLEQVRAADHNTGCYGTRFVAKILYHTEPKKASLL